MKIVKLTLMFAVLLSTCCGGSQAEPPGPEGLATREGFAEVHERLSFVRWGTFPVTAPPQERTAAYSVEDVLPKLHPWLSERRGLSEAWEGEYGLLKLSRIPAAVLRDLLNASYPDTRRPGFLLLRADFWRRVNDLQQAGFTIAFITRSPTLVAGVYFSARKLIAFDLFANEGTLDHEFRHHEQWLALSRRQAAREKARSWWQAAGPKAVAWSCLRQASMYFGELDATTVQLPTWRRVVSELPVVPASLEEAKRIDGWFVMTVPQLLSANLEYPVSAADGPIQEESCPQAFRDLLLGLKTELGREKASVADDTLIRLYAARGEAARLLIAAEKRCGEKVLECGDTAAKLAQIRAEVDRKKAAIEARLVQVVERRRELVREHLSRIPREEHADLCDYASGFSFLSDCAAVGGERGSR